jgi:hypothetical protein
MKNRRRKYRNRVRNLIQREEYENLMSSVTIQITTTTNFIE